MRFGINLFGVWKELEKDPAQFCRKVRSYGYRYLEPCVAVTGRIEGVPQFIDEDTLSALIGTAKAEGLTIESVHAGVTDEEQAEQRLVYLAKTYGIRQFVFGCPGEFTLEAYEARAQKLLSWADTLAKEGAEILLHNGGPDSAAQIDGMAAYEWMVRRCKGRIFAEPDAGWMMYGDGDGKGGMDPEAFLWRNKESIHAFHYKDFAENADGTWRHCEIGTGVVDMTAMFQFSRAAEVVQYADQDVFADVMGELESVGKRLQRLQDVRDNSRSILCIFDTETGRKQVLHTFDHVIEAPNWLKDGDTLIYNADGKIYSYSISGDEENLVDTGFCDKCNNDHVIAPDESEIAVSHFTPDWVSAIYRIPLRLTNQGTDASDVSSQGNEAAGFQEDAASQKACFSDTSDQWNKAAGSQEASMSQKNCFHDSAWEPFRVTGNMHSFLHGWSPDGKELAFCGFRPDENGNLAVDVITVSVEGGEEHVLTGHQGFNDGPEYGPDGTIWFISTRSGLMQVWHMNADGTDPKQMTFEEQNNWFGHISPDGKKVVNIAYSKDGLDPNQHLPNMDVSLWLMNADGTGRRKILDFFGGQGSINVNSWAPDSRRFAYVEYELLHK